MIKPILLLLLLSAVLCNVASGISAPATCGRDPTNVIAIGNDLAVAFCSDRIIRVVRTTSSDGGESAAKQMVQRESLVIDPASATSQPFTHYKTKTIDGEIVALKTKEMLVQVSRNHRNETCLAFLDHTGSRLFTSELPEHVEVQSDDDNNIELSHRDTTKTIQQTWASFPEESIYGGGQYTNGFVDYKGAPIHLVQLNLEVAIPFFTSSNGYGILWDSYGETWLNPPNRSNSIDLSTPYNLRARNEDSHVVTGTFTPLKSGDYWLIVDMQAGPNRHEAVELKLEAADEDSMVADCRIHEWNAPIVMICKAANLTSSISYNVQLEYDSEVQPLLFYKHTKDGYRRTTIQTEDAEFVDYYFMISDANASREDSFTAMDSLIASYRNLTGPAALFSKKAYGFWQCKEHYHNQSEILESAKQHRKRGIPVDNIVQDWH